MQVIAENLREETFILYTAGDCLQLLMQVILKCGLKELESYNMQTEALPIELVLAISTHLH